MYYKNIQKNVTCANVDVSGAIWKFNKCKWNTLNIRYLPVMKQDFHQSWFQLPHVCRMGMKSSFFAHSHCAVGVRVGRPQQGPQHKTRLQALRHLLVWPPSRLTKEKEGLFHCIIVFNSRFIDWWTRCICFPKIKPRTQMCCLPRVRTDSFTEMKNHSYDYHIYFQLKEMVWSWHKSGFENTDTNNLKQHTGVFRLQIHIFNKYHVLELHI